MMKRMGNEEYRRTCENVMNDYMKAGLSPVDCLDDISVAKGEVAWSEGYSDAALVGGIALTLAGLILKGLARREAKRYGKSIGQRVAFAAQCQTLTQMADRIVPGQEEEEKDE